jgi:carboxymethylenebutenolidase
VAVSFHRRTDRRTDIRDPLECDMAPISRRSVLSGLAGLSCTLATRHPGFAAGGGPPLQPVAIRAGDGRRLTAFLSLPERLPAPAVLTVHGSLGLTDWYRSQAAAFAREGFVGLAVELFPGRLAWDLDGERSLIADADHDIASTTDTLAHWVDWLTCDPRTNGRVGLVGWSFGAWWALVASTARAVDATVLYYGLRYGDGDARGEEAAALARLSGPVLGLFGERDESIPRDQVERFREALTAARKSVEIDWYPAGHGFANMTLDGYDAAAAAASWRRAAAFLRTNLASSRPIR